MQVFLEFVVFNKQFIVEFSQITNLLTKMTKESHVMARFG